jgi:hypothetical protein
MSQCWNLSLISSDLFNYVENELKISHFMENGEWRKIRVILFKVNIAGFF